MVISTMTDTLLFLRINRVYDRYVPQKKESWRIFEYEHIGRKWSADDHDWSPDKDRYPHCYDEIVADQHYLVLSRQVQGLQDLIGTAIYNRWVWLGCMPLTETQIRKVWQYYVASGRDMRAAVEYADRLVNPRIDLDNPTWKF